MRQGLELRQVPTTFIIGDSLHARHMRRFAKRLAGTTYPVLISGETGVGKEVAAMEIHRHEQSDVPFVPVNCSALSRDLFESEMFGHRKGSFTGAVDDREGFLESAGDGMVFLDEVGTLSLALQVKLLRVLQDGKFNPVGERRQIQMKARVVAATNIDLQESIRKGEFRSDLFYRLNVILFNVPPLRKRLEDLPLLVEYFLQKEGLSKKFTASALVAMGSYDWPGNIRQLGNIVRRAVFLADECEQVGVEHIKLCIEEAGTDGDGSSKNVCPDSFVEKAATNGRFPTLREVKKVYLCELLKRTGGNMTRSSRISGLTLRSMRNWVRSFGLKDLVRSIKKEVEEKFT